MNSQYIIPYSEDFRDNGEERSFVLPFLAGLALTAPFWGWGCRGCRFPYYQYPYPLPTPFPYPYPVPSPYFYSSGRPFVY